MDIFLFNKRNKIRPKFLNPIYGFRKNGRIDFMQRLLQVVLLVSLQNFLHLQEDKCICDLE